MTAVLPTPTPIPAAPLVDPDWFGVYLHVPFCLTRCHYCDFVTYTGMEGLRRPYVAALLDEAAMAVAALGPEPPPVTSVFIGGGTPTLLAAGDLARVLERLRALLPFAPGAEVTVEANPETVDAAMAAGLAGAGVTRVSMGAQSFDDRVLAALGRVHDADRVAAAVATLREAGVPALNLDLIYGGPGEDAGSWAATLAGAVPRPGGGGARVRRVRPALERQRGAGLPQPRPGGAAARRRGGAPRPRPGPVRGAGPAAADGRRARPGGGPGARGRPRRRGGDPPARRRAAGPAPRAGPDRAGD